MGMASSSSTVAAAVAALLFAILLASAAAAPVPPTGTIRSFIGQPDEVLRLQHPVNGPESLAFDNAGEGPYTGVSDGRVLKWQSSGGGGGWKPFAAPSALVRPAEVCDGSGDLESEPLCGRPLGLQFHRKTGRIYIADAYLGLMSVDGSGGDGGDAEILADEAEGVPFRFTNGVDVDQETGEVYFTDSSTRYDRREHDELVTSGDASGRLMRYDPATAKVTVLLRGLSFPNGVVVSSDGDFLLVAETTNRRVLRYWLRGPRAGAVDIFAVLPGYPDNIRKGMNSSSYWVGIAGQGWPSRQRHVVGVRLGGDGDVLEVLDGERKDSVSEVVERGDGTLWVGSVEASYVGVYRRRRHGGIAAVDA